jgi:putative transposase
MCTVNGVCAAADQSAEQHAAVARIRELGRGQVDESALFSMVEQMRQITEDAAAKTRKARRSLQRRFATPSPREAAVVPPPPVVGGDVAAGPVATPFEVIEQR